MRLQQRGPRLAWLFVVGCLTVGPAWSSAQAPAGRSQESEAPAFDYFGGLEYAAEIPSPESVLGYCVGERFTRHPDVLAYLRRLAEASDRVMVESYGASHQRRELLLVTISAPANLARLDEILARNRELADPRTGDPARALETIETNPAIVWLSYNVHGNEASCTETAIQLAYTLAAATNKEVEQILENIVVVVDPLLNPDGHERYVNWFDNTMGTDPNANPDAAEHDEPWPGGRTNHYLFDLNRDWLWLTQPESRGRIAMYRRYLPQLHVDYHEQEYTNPYFFGAGADPYHAQIPEETRAWLDRYGRANAEVFDREGLLYSTRERFDYLYPGYGTSLPIFHGAIGLLCEQAGHSAGGTAIEVGEQYTLTLAERARHHFLTSMSYLETTAAHRRAQLERFRRFFEQAGVVEPEGPHAFVIRADNDPAMLAKVWDLCSAHGIEIHRLDAEARLGELHSYRDGEEVDETVPAGSWVIRVDQPLGRLARVLFEREATVSEIDTYDITAWSLPLAFGLRAYYTTGPLDAATTRLEDWQEPGAEITGEGEVALLVDARQHRFPQAVGIAVRHEIAARFAGDEFEIDGRWFGAGSLIVHRVMNAERDLEGFAADLVSAGINVHRASSGLTTAGPVLGANANREAELPRVILLRGEPFSALSYGQHWYLLDVESPLPHVPVNADSLGGVDLGEYNVLVLPHSHGDLGSVLGEPLVAQLKEWVAHGGVVVATGGSASWASRALLDLGEGEGAAAPDAEEGGTGEEEPADSERTYEERRAREVHERVPGALLEAIVDTSHPLAVGAPDWVAVLKDGGRTLPVRDDGYVIARFAESPLLSGVMSEESAERISGTPFATYHPSGRGAVICFSDDTTVRAFNHGPMRLLLNAIVYGPSL